MSLSELTLLATTFLGTVALLLNHWDVRPSKQVRERFEQVDARDNVQDERLNTLEAWVDSVRKAGT